MPIASGARGRSFPLAMPSGGWTPQSGYTRLLLGGWTPRSGFDGNDGPFRSPAFSTQGYTITGVTKDSTGAPLGEVTLDLFDTRTDAFIATTTSDGSGNYSFGVSGGGSYYLVAYKAGVPDVAGTTANTLVAS